MDDAKAQSRRGLMVLGGRELLERVSALHLPDCDLHHAGRAQDALRVVEEGAPVSLAIVRTDAPAAAALPALKRALPDLPLLLLTTDHTLAGVSPWQPRGHGVRIIAHDAGPDALHAAIAESMQTSALPRHDGDPLQAAAGGNGQGPRERDVNAAGARQAGLSLKADWKKILAHDLRTPLGISNTYAELLLGDADAGLDPAAREVVQRILGSGRWMLAFVERMLAWERMQQGRAVLEPEDTSLEELLESVAVRMQGLAMPNRVRIECASVQGATTHRIDRTRVEQVLQNLLANAIRYSPTGGTVRVAAGADAARLTFQVRDEGPGMTPAEARQALNGYAAQNGTSGIGLAIAKAIVELHGGQIHVDSAPGRGSTFHFTIAPAP